MCSNACRRLTYLFRSLRPLVISLIPGQEKQLEKLKAMRVELQKEVRDTIDEFGPKLFDDYDDVRSLSIVYTLY